MQHLQVSPQFSALTRHQVSNNNLPLSLPRIWARLYHLDAWGESVSVVNNPVQVYQRRRLQSRAVSLRVLYRGAGGQKESRTGLDPL